MKRIFFACLLLSLLPECSPAAMPQRTRIVSERDPLGTKDANWFERQGRKAAASGDTVRAEQYLAAALDKGGDASRLLPLLLKVTLSASRLRSALNYAEPQLLLRPSDFRLRLLVATIRFALGQYEDAHHELRRLVLHSPELSAGYYLLGLIEADHFENAPAAREHFLTYLRLAPHGRHAAEVRARLSEMASGLQTLHSEARHAPVAFRAGGAP